MAFRRRTRSLSRPRRLLPADVAASQYTAYVSVGICLIAIANELMRLVLCVQRHSPLGVELTPVAQQ
jgi:hypothetical protein